MNSDSSEASQPSVADKLLPARMGSRSRALSNTLYAEAAADSECQQMSSSQWRASRKKFAEPNHGSIKKAQWPDAEFTFGVPAAAAKVEKAKEMQSTSMDLGELQDPTDIVQGQGPIDMEWPHQC